MQIRIIGQHRTPTSIWKLTRIFIASACLQGMLLSWTLSAEVIRDNVQIWKKSDLPVEAVSFVQLIANPSAFHGKAVSVRGYYSFGEEESVLHYTKEHADQALPYDSISVTFDRAVFSRADLSRFGGAYVLVEGIFDTTLHGHLNSSSFATLRDVNRIVRLPVLSRTN